MEMDQDAGREPPIIRQGGWGCRFWGIRWAAHWMCTRRPGGRTGLHLRLREQPGCNGQWDGKPGAVRAGAVGAELCPATKGLEEERPAEDKLTPGGSTCLPPCSCPGQGSTGSARQVDTQAGGQTSDRTHGAEEGEGGISEGEESGRGRRGSRGGALPGKAPSRRKGPHQGEGSAVGQGSRGHGGGGAEGQPVGKGASRVRGSA